MLAGGCTDNSSATPTEPSTGDDSGTWADLPLTGLAFRTPRAELVEMIDAFNATTVEEYADCMARAGVPGADKSMTVSSGETTLANTGLHPQSIREAETEGLNLTNGVRLLQSMQAPPNRPPSEEIPFGDFKECSGPDSTEIKKQSEIYDSYERSVMAQPSIATAREGWGECMRDAGYDVADIYELRSLLLPPEDAARRAQLPTSEQSDFDEQLLLREREAATSVVQCDRSAYFPVIPEWAAAERDWMDENAEAIRRLPDYQRYLWASSVRI